MDADTQRHLFEPFFTTKEVGKGTGLGLATVYGIVQQSGGSIFVYSEPERGTTFKIYLPRAEGDVPASVEAGLAVARDGHETVLVVEDEAPVRRLVASVLTRHGYRVLEASGPEAGRDIEATYDGPIDLLITDMIMPGGTGADLAARFAARRPTARVLVMSGYTQDTLVHGGALGDGVAFLEKPFSPDALLSCVRDLLHVPRA